MPALKPEYRRAVDRAKQSFINERRPFVAGDIIVLKFGSSVLPNRAQLPTAVHEIYHWYRAGWRVVAIVSAIGKTTENLLSEARQLAEEPSPHATAELLATGERHSAALLGIALDRAGVHAKVVDPREIGLTTRGTALDSELVSVDSDCLQDLLRQVPVLVVPGFFGYGEHGQLQLLGRGGSDLTAVYLAQAMGARRCRLIKDVDGVYERDPALTTSAPTRRYLTLGYAEALQCARQLIQPKAVNFLERHSASAEVAGIARAYESTVGNHACMLIPAAKVPPLSVLILGLGTVGYGVYQRVSAMHHQFRVVGVLVRNRAKHAGKVADELLFDSQEALAHLRPDIVVDALPGLEPSLTLARQFLVRGVHLVTANKTLVVEAGAELASLAACHAASVLHSAAVGGSVPMLESLQASNRHLGIDAIAGVLNGTCNYILDRCTEGLSLEDAVKAAHEGGFAEADPTEDLSGRDAARKLTLLARQAFGAECHSLEIEPLDHATLTRGRQALEDGQVPRLIARLRKAEGRLFGQIRLEALAIDDPLAQAHREWNTLIITLTDGETVCLTGRGAGRWPTTEAVMADLLDLSEELPPVEENSEQPLRANANVA